MRQDIRTTQQSLQKINDFLNGSSVKRSEKHRGKIQRDTYSGLAQRKRTGLIRILTIL